MKILLLILLIPFISYSQEMNEQEFFNIYKSCLLEYTKDTSRPFFIRESTSFQKIVLSNPDDLNKMRFSHFSNPPPVDSNFLILTDKYLDLESKTSDLKYLTKFDTKNSIEIFTDEKFNEIFKKSNGWKKFHKYFKNKNEGYYEFSPIVYSNNLKYAMLYMGHHSDDKAGAGYLILCQKDKDCWIVKHLIWLWIS